MKESSPIFVRAFTAALQSAGLKDRPLTKGECQSSTARRCTLCSASRITYDQELPVKEAALRGFWAECMNGTPIDPLIPSPRGREYRGVTKRKVFHEDDSATIGLIDPSEPRSGRFDPILCMIEPPEHAAIYSVVRRELARPDMVPLAAQLKYVIVKGLHSSLVIMFNVGEIAPGVVKSANTLSKRLSSAGVSLAGSFLFEGNEDERYYQESSGRRTRGAARKLFGKSECSVTVNGARLSFSPMSFTQVNHSMLGPLVITASSLLQLRRELNLYDLYCGYGLFALSLAGQVRSVVGVERSMDSVDAARSNATRLRLGNVRFIGTDITASSLEALLRNVRPGDAVLLDPPRSGTGVGILESVAARKPGRVLHVFCNIDHVAAEIKRWTDAGYRPVRAVPLDMFPGTPNVELLVLLEQR